MQSFGVIGLVAVLGLVAMASSSEAQYADEALTGIKVGEKAPDFTLKDQNGNDQTLSKLLENGPMVLFFNRSASW